VGLYIRKGFNFGPLRLNLSRSGLGASFGVKGARIGIGPRGSYIHVGRGGLYYRQSLPLGSTRAENSNAPSAPKISEKIQEKDLQVVASAAASQMIDSSAAAVLRELNRVKKRFDRFPLVLITGIGVLALLLVRGTAWWELFSFGVAACTLAVYARHSDVTHGTAILNYSLEPDSERHFSQLKAAFKKLTDCDRVWHIDASGHMNDVKRHAGATALLQRAKAQASFSSPPKVQCNIEIPALSGKHKSLYFFPDHLLVYDSTGVGAVSYEQLEAGAEDTRYIEEESIPRASTRVGTTWKYLNKNGGPDRRFNNNRQIPVMLYGLLSLSSKSGLKEIFQCSTPGVPKQITAALAQIAGAPEPLRGQSEPLGNLKREPQMAGPESSDHLPEKTSSEAKLPKGIYFCQVKGITHDNEDGTSRSEVIQHCSVGDAVKLIPDPQNVHDHNAIRVELLNGEAAFAQAVTVASAYGRMLT
jgi:uncharacterized protein DUF4236